MAVVKWCNSRYFSEVIFRLNVLIFARAAAGLKVSSRCPGPGQWCRGVGVKVVRWPEEQQHQQQQQHSSTLSTCPDTLTIITFLHMQRRALAFILLCGSERNWQFICKNMCWKPHNHQTWMGWSRGSFRMQSFGNNKPNTRLTVDSMPGLVFWETEFRICSEAGALSSCASSIFIPSWYHQFMHEVWILTEAASDLDIIAHILTLIAHMARRIFAPAKIFAILQFLCRLSPSPNQSNQAGSDNREGGRQLKVSTNFRGIKCKLYHSFLGCFSAEASPIAGLVRKDS